MQHYKYYTLLSCLMITILITCDAIAFKSVQWHGFHFAASGLIFPLAFLLHAS